MNLDCIAQTLIEAGCATQLGIDIFEHHIPSTVAQGILLRTPMDGIPINHYIPGFYKARIQVILRSKSHAYGDSQALIIDQALTMYRRVYIDTAGNTLMTIIQSFPTTLPIVYPRTAGNEYEWSCNFLFHYIMPANSPAAIVSGPTSSTGAVSGALGISNVVSIGEPL